MLSLLKAKKNSTDYFLAGRKVKPWLVGLSSYATLNSGWMFIGQTSYTYLYGLSSIWLLTFWPIGDFVASLFFHKKFRIISEKQNLLSYGDVLVNWYGQKKYVVFRFIVGLAVVIFLGIYASAQFKAGSKALHIIFDWPEQWGIILGVGMVLIYCWSGGVRASIWTDAIQGIVMLVSMAGLVFVAIYELGGMGSFISSLYTISPTYMNVFPVESSKFFLGPLLFLGGWFFAGIGVIGQPHVMTRFMTINDPENIKKARLYYYPCIIILSALCILAGFAARLTLNLDAFDSELVYPLLSLKLLPGVFVGIMLAGLFSAAISTADSQILSCSSSLTRDILQLKNVSYFASKLSTIFLCIIILFFSLYANNSVFSLVLVSWAFLAASFTPILILYSLGEKLNERTLILTMIVGVTICLLWKYVGLDELVYEVAPSVVGALVYYVIFHKFLAYGVRKIKS